ncbi:hypothetical protein PIB30_087965 [Stylosanthes scabra]|uniref:Uncharacterized protein n=1 Tax=Stylosanthes scabra TaxID=79078 RepID=A0ABU6USG3_9FABA|nr:hypothetical protein [Stylosanthes scabra]
MSDKKQRGKEKVKARDQRKFAKSKLPTSMFEDERLDGSQGMDDVLKRLPSEIPSKFPNKYSQMKFKDQMKFKEIVKRSLHFERRLEIPDNLLKFVLPRIEIFKWEFLERELAQVNGTWVQEFYSKLHNEDLDSVFLRGKQIPAPPKGNDAFQKAKEAHKTFTMDWNIILDRLTKLGSS